MKFSIASYTAALVALSSLATALPAQLSSRANTNTEDRFDDSDPRITYTGDWTHLTNQGNTISEGTLSYSNSSQATIRIPYGKTHSGFYMRMGSKADRGQFSIFLGDDFWFSTTAKGDCVTNCPENDLVVNFPRLIAPSEDTELVIQNDSPGFLAFDYIDLHWAA
ncbi:hypothetical protein JCM10449v2_006916 [Rhodotorula kratochvilovae]